MSGPGTRRLGAATTRRYAATQTKELKKEVNCKSTEEWISELKRQVTLERSPPRSPVTRSKALSAQRSPSKTPDTGVRKFFGRSPPRGYGSASGIQQRRSSPSAEHSNHTVIGDDPAQQEETECRDDNSAEQQGTECTPIDPAQQEETDCRDENSAQQQGTECTPIDSAHQERTECTPTSNHEDTSKGSAARSSSNRRGPTRGIGLERMSRQKKLSLTISPTKGRPTNPTESAKFSSEIGIAARHHLPVNTKIKALPKTAIDESLAAISSKFDVDFKQQPHIERAAVAILKDRNRGQRCKLHKHYLKFSSLEEAKRNPPKDVDGDKWEELCDYWASPEFIHRSTVNKANRGNKATHSGGSRAFVVHHYEKGDPIEGYKATHKKKDGEWTSPEAEAAWDQMDRMVASELEAEVEGESVVVDSQKKQSIMTNVLGMKGGRLVGFGLGPEPRQAKKTKREEVIAAELQESRKKNEELENEIHDLQNENEELKKQNEEQDKRISNLESILPVLKGIPALAQYFVGSGDSSQGNSMSIRS